MPIPTTNPVSSLVHPLGEFPPDAIVFGKSEAMQSLRSRMDKVASANVPVLINGESGTGKDIVARMIHGLSPWKSGPFVKVNCPAIPGTLLESELFGYEKGAFTGAYGMKPGRVEMAHRGTLFLDEISELDLALQSKLLQLLQDGQFCRIGAQEDKKVEVRIVCATNRQLDVEIENGTFRQDLYYRINVVNLRMPPLRERPEDIPALVRHFVAKYAERMNKIVDHIPSETMDAMVAYEWPGNVRQLQNFIEHGVIVSRGASFEPPLGQLRLPKSASAPKKNTKTLEDATRDHVLQALEDTKWVVGGRHGAAARLGIARTTLIAKMRRLGIDLARDEAQSKSARGQHAFGALA